MKKIEVSCEVCNNKFFRSVSRYNEAVKFGWKHFCSSSCQGVYRTRSLKLLCENCNKEITVRKTDYDKSKSKNFFCGNSCSATYNNSKRIISEEHKKHTSESITAYHKKRIKNGESHGLKLKIEKTCLVCGKKYLGIKKRKVCSIECSRIYQFGSLPLTKEEAIKAIQIIAEKENHTPSSKQVSRKLHHAIKKYFKSWNEGMKELGLEPNTQWMIRKNFACADGHKADSISEKIIDDWFNENNLKHERWKNYPEGKYTCDFYLVDYDIWVEYFGLINEHRDYDLTVEKKRELIQKHNLKFIEIKPENLYPENKLDEIKNIISQMRV